VDDAADVGAGAGDAWLHRVLVEAVLACLGVDIPPLHSMPANIANPEQVAEVVAKISGYDRVTT
jgi:citrate lyase beta subunit